MNSREGLTQEGGLVAVHDVEVNVGRVGAVVGVVEGLLREAVLHKLVKVDEQWIPREGGKRLVGESPYPVGPIGSTCQYF